MTVAVQDVDLDRSLLVFGSAFDSTEATQTELSGQIINSSEVTFQRDSGSSSAPTVPVHYYLAEFESGVRVQRGSAVVDDSTETVSLDEPVDPSRSVPLITLRNDDSTYDIDDFVRAELMGESELSLETYQVIGEAVVEWQVVSFENPLTRVQTGTVSLDSGEVLLRTSLAQPIDPSKTWLVFSYQLDDIRVQTDEAMVRGLVDSDTELVFERAGTGTVAEITYYAVTFGGETSVQSGIGTFGDSDTAVMNTIISVDPEKSIALAAGGYQRSGAAVHSDDANPGYSTFLLDLGVGSELIATRGSVGVSANLNWSVIEFH